MRKRTASVGFAIWLCLLPVMAAVVPPQPPPQTPPRPISPVDYFRGLLNLSGPDREKQLAAKPEPQRKYLLAKLKEYEALPANERERQLQTASLRWYLRPLMEVPAENRRDKLLLMPQEYRPIIEQRLREWDRLPPELQKEVLENDWMAQYVVRFDSATAAERQEILIAYAPSYRQSVEAGLERWHGFPPEKRERIYQNFHQFFELSREEQNKTLQAVSEGERRQVAQIMGALESMPPDQRNRCLQALKKFTSMTLVERAQFLKNAQRWREMSPRERAAWRQLTARVPPLPPGALPPPPGTLPALPGSLPALPGTTVPPGPPPPMPNAARSNSASLSPSDLAK